MTKLMKMVMTRLASKYLALKARMRGLENRVTIHWLLLQDRKVIRHFFCKRRHFNLPNMVEGELQSDDAAALVNNFTTTPVSTVRLETDCSDPLGGVDDENDQSDNIYAAGKDNIVAEQEEAKKKVESMEMEDCWISVAEMEEGQGKELRLEDNIDIDLAAELFIERFHRSQKLQCEGLR